MNMQDLYQGLLAAGYPVAYRQFRSAPPLPYMVYLYVGGDDFHADNSNYHPIGRYHIELYTAEKDPVAEVAAEDALRALGLTWSKDEAFIDSEDMHQVLYQVQLI